MYKIEKKGYGFKLVFEGFIKIDELQDWVEDSKKALTGAPKKFGVLIDMRTLKPLLADAQEVMVQGQGLFKSAGMERSAVLVPNSLVANQFKRLAQTSGIYAFERYIDASAVSNFETVAEEWIRLAKDPDKV
ncbi:MAG: hypothetical protein LWX56_02565 [Ignavibacteria bacterium]|nr:hypothetical protein [Ignavibacteria bacterium]